MNKVCILGGGPAGSSAAIAACQEGANVQIMERSQFPRHKVCGEFLSPGIEQALDRLGLGSSFRELRPTRIQRMRICIGATEKSALLREVGYGLSRHSFDSWLWREAMQAGATHVQTGEPNVIATGRNSRVARGGRLFGFKAHFRGPVDDAVELYFQGSTYVGLNCVEDGLTNVCGIAPEEDLRSCHFDVDLFLHQHRPVRARLGPLRRNWDWIFTGPLEFRNGLKTPLAAYAAGDAVSFVDPFTGSGLLCAVMTGSLAGKSAAQGIPIAQYVEQCAGLLRRPFQISSVLRSIAQTRVAGPLLRLTPANLIFNWTRP